jgi:hypothetical protein
MRSISLAVLAAAATFTAAAPAAFAHDGGYPYDGYSRYDGYHRSYDYDRGWRGVDMGAIRDKCENDWRRAQWKGNTGGNSYRSYIAKCVDRDASASARQARRDAWRNDYYRRGW